MDTNVCIFVGRLGADAEKRSSSSGERNFLTYSIAVSQFGDSRDNPKPPLWVRCIDFQESRVNGKLPEYLTKGKQVLVQCEARPNTYTPKDSDKEITTIEFNVRNIQLLGDAGQSTGQATQAEPQTTGDPVPF